MIILQSLSCPLQLNFRRAGPHSPLLRNEHRVLLLRGAVAVMTGEKSIAACQSRQLPFPVVKVLITAAVNDQGLCA